jgi:hypothetical protein
MTRLSRAISEHGRIDTCAMRAKATSTRLPSSIEMVIPDAVQQPVEDRL